MRTVDQKSNALGFPKAGEMIQITGDHELEAGDRAVLDLLYEHAHNSGRLTEQGAEFTIGVSQLRASLHHGTDRVRDSLERLMKVQVAVPFRDPDTGEEMVLLTHLFDFFMLPAKEDRPGATVRYGLPTKLLPIIARSEHWGRIKSEVVCAMTSRYAMKLYELVQLRANLRKCVETIPIDRFRELMGVPPGKLERGCDFRARVIEPALLEVNGLSDYGVEIDLVRQRTRGPIVAVSLAWWKKEGEEYREVQRERQRPKLGRMARLKGQVESVSSTGPPGVEDE
jgi:hypothetical protein